MTIRYLTKEKNITPVTSSSAIEVNWKGRRLTVQVIRDDRFFYYLGLRGLGRALTIDDIGKRVIRCCPPMQLLDWSYNCHFNEGFIDDKAQTVFSINPLKIHSFYLSGKYMNDSHWMGVDEYRAFIHENKELLESLRSSHSPRPSLQRYEDQHVPFLELPLSCWERGSFAFNAHEHSAPKSIDPFEAWAKNASLKPKNTFSDYSYYECSFEERPEKMQTALKTLLLDEDADLKDIKNQYKLLVLKHHPDKSKEDSNTFIAIHQAYTYLMDALKFSSKVFPSELEEAYLEGKCRFQNLIELEGHKDSTQLARVWMQLYDGLFKIPLTSDSKLNLLFKDLLDTCRDHSLYYQIKRDLDQQKASIQTIISLPQAQQKGAIKQQLEKVLTLIELYDVHNKKQQWQIFGLKNNGSCFKKINDLVLDRVLALNRMLAEVYLTEKNYKDAIGLKKEATRFLTQQNFLKMTNLFNALEKKSVLNPDPSFSKTSTQQPKTSSQKTDEEKTPEKETKTKTTEDLEMQSLSLKENIKRNLTFFDISEISF